MTTVKELLEALKATGIPTTNEMWAKGEAPVPPYICLHAQSSDPYGADNITWVSPMAYDVELYCERRDYATEYVVEEALDAAEVFWAKSNYEIDTESLNETVYSVTVRED